MPLYLQSEKVGPTGAVTSRGVINQLGRSKLDPLAILVREAVQNSWDARSSSRTPVEISHPITFGVAGWTLPDYQRQRLQNLLFAKLPSVGDDKLPLGKVLGSEKPIQAIVIYDRGTTGLGGPTRADTATSGDEPRDFVDFLRNVGQPPDKQLAGGTYGYGKAALYRASYTNTILVHTRCEYQGKIESRFICSALGYPYTIDGVPYTGRHWWGSERDGIAEPLLDDLADQVAKYLEFPDINGDKLGTSIMILQPMLEEFDAEDGSINRTAWQAMNSIAENVLYYFWPKMLHYPNESPAINFEVSWEGREISIPAPENYPPLTGYADAMHRLKGYDIDSQFPYRQYDIGSERPRKHLGKLVLQKFPYVYDDAFDTGRERSLFSDITHHTALMRQPELIVKYLPGPVSPNPQLGYAGVFITDRDVDSIFADSEPPTHDDWVAEGLDHRWHKIFVRVAQNRILQYMDAFAKPTEVEPKARELIPLGAFSNSLGASLLASIPANSASTPFSQNYQQPRLGGSLSRTAKNQQFGSPSQQEGFKGLVGNILGQLGNSSQTNGTTVDTEELHDETQELPPAPQYTPSASSPLPQPTDIHNIPVFRRSQNAGEQNPPPTQRKKLGKSRIKEPTTTFVSVEGQSALQVGFQVSHGENAVGTEVSVHVSAVLDGGALETEPPIGGSKAEVIRWIDPDNQMFEGSEQVFVSAETTGIWHVLVSLPGDIMIDVDLDAQAVGGEL